MKILFKTPFYCALLFIFHCGAFSCILHVSNKADHPQTLRFFSNYLRNSQRSCSHFSFKISGPIYRKVSSLVQICIVSCISFISMYFLIFLAFSSLTHWLLSSVLFNFLILGNFSNSSCSWFLILFHCSWRTYFVWF